ncbi:MAG: hypothetical protein ABEJ98_05755 [Candidatus Nanohaloarchaea archaeon]
MNKLAVVTALALLFSGLAASQVYYEVDANQDAVRVNATVVLECDTNCPVNSWSLTWRRPEDAELISVRDSLGKIEEYTVEGRKITVQTNSGRARMNETVRMQFLISNDAEEVYDGLYKRTISLAGLEGERTTGVVRAEDLLSGKTGFGFETGFNASEMRFRGQGPVFLRFKFGEGRETDYFSFFGDYPGNATDAYEIPVGTLGIYQEFRRFPVAVMPGEVYNRTVNSWSAGEYVSGSMAIRSGLGEDFLPVLAHEVVHGLNDRRLKWDSTRSSYIDEGIAEHVESLVRKKKGMRTRNVFGDPVTYRKLVDGQIYRYSLSSKGDRDALWNYYRNEREFMKTWNAMEAIPANREFGYAYSELIIKNYIANMNGSLRRFYRELEVKNEVSDPRVKWGIYSDFLDMTPCKYESRQRFEQCLESINSYDYPVYSGVPQRGESVLRIERVEVENRTEFRRRRGRLRSINLSFQDFFNYLADYFSRIFQALKASF